MTKTNVFNDALSNLGSEIVTLAAQQEEAMAQAWHKVRTMFSLAQSVGAEQEAFTLLFEAGDKVLVRKALWYRRMKRTLKACMDLGIDIRPDMDFAGAMQAVSEAQRAGRTPAQVEADAMRMFERTAKGAMNVVGSKTQLIKSLKTDKSPTKRVLAQRH